MAAPNIPNLNTLRSSHPPGRGRGRGRGRGFRDPGATREDDIGANDRIIQRTDQDASGSRLSAVSLGYLKDDFARYFYADEVPTRRYPIINRGTYVRTSAIDHLVEKFLSVELHGEKQIISLGAGTDTRYFRLMSKALSCPLVYHEIDFVSNTTEKIRIIKQTPSLLSVITSHLDDPDSLLISANGCSLSSSTYNIHALDLRTISSTSIPSLPNLSSTAPTLVISECCLIYLPPESTSNILTTFTHHLLPSPTPVAVIIYEPTRPNDAFGRTMVSNLASRGIHLQTLHTFDNLTAQRSRLRVSGLTSDQRAADIDFIWEKWVSKTEKERVARCEMLDEVEEWVLLARHYCVAWGWRDLGDDGVISTAWGDINGQAGD